MERKQVWGWTASARERCCNSHVCQESGSWEARSHKRRAWALTCSLDLDLPGSDHDWAHSCTHEGSVSGALAPAETRKVQHDADDFCGCSGKSCDRAAWLIRCWCQQQKGGREPSCCSGQGHALRFDSASSHAGVFHTKDGVFWRSTWRVVGRSGRSCTGAVAPHRRRNFCWQPNAVEDRSGHTAVFPMMVS